MDSYVKDSIQRLIIESKILIVPDNVTIEDALQQEGELLLEKQSSNVEQPAATVISFLPEDDENDFEQIYQFAKAKKLNKTVSLLVLEPNDNAYNRSFLDS